MSVRQVDLQHAHSIVRRIRLFLGGLERARRQPNRREAYHICRALEHLRAGELRESEESLQSADRREPMPKKIADDLAYNEPPTVQQLQAALDSAEAEPGMSP